MSAPIQNGPETAAPAAGSEGASAPGASIDPGQITGQSTPGAGTDNPALAPAPAAQPAPAATGGEGDPKVFPADYVTELRSENAKLRVDMRDGLAQARTEAEQRAQEAAAAAAAAATQELTEKFGRVLGYVNDEAPKDPAELLAQAETARTQAEQQAAQAQSALRTAKVEAAVFKAADPAGANAMRLLDSRDFMESVSGLDPAADDFGAQLAAKIAAKVDADPAFKRVPDRVVPPASGGDMSGGNGGEGSNEPPSVEALRKQRSQLREGRRRTRASAVNGGASTPIPAAWGGGLQ